MANDSDWVADVRRWYFSSQQAKPGAAPSVEPSQDLDVGYEAAQPALQSPQWAESVRSST